MRSSSGAHFVAFDHLRALGSFMVCTWHFVHAADGFPVPFEFTSSFAPVALFDEGHTGVSLFMVMSGYLLAKLTEGRSIRFGPFLWNRAIRLLPLLLVVVLIVGVRTAMRGQDVLGYLGLAAQGVLRPTLPNGGWSITVEFHFYVVLPLLLWMLRRSASLPLVVVLVAVAARFVVHRATGTVQNLAYLTLLGRVDQFVVGMVAYRLRGLFTKRHVLVALLLVAFVLAYADFDARGGFYRNGGYPSPSPIWIVLPLLEAVGYAVAVAWYETSFVHSTGAVSTFLGRVGEATYSVYLLHFFFVFAAARAVHEHVMDISNFYVAWAWALAFFLAMYPLARLSFRFVETPFLRFRRPYAEERKAPAAVPAS